MTTAHRPTYNPKIGTSNNNGQPTLQISVRDLPANTKIKYRDRDKNTSKKEENGFKTPLSTRPGNIDRNEMILLLKKRERDAEFKKITEVIKEKKGKFIEKSSEEEGESDSGENSQEGEDIDVLEDREIIKELEKLKREKISKEKDKEKMLRAKVLQIYNNNPLLNKKSSKKATEQSLNSSYFESTIHNTSINNNVSKWYEDAIFKNKYQKERKVKRFINSTTGNDYHKKFMDELIH